MAGLYHGVYYEPGTLAGTQQFEAVVGGGVKLGLGMLGMRLGVNPPTVITLTRYRDAGYVPFIGVSFLPADQILDPQGRPVAYNPAQVGDWMAADASYRMKDTAGHVWNLPSISGKGTAADAEFFLGRINALAWGLAQFSPNPLFLNLAREMNGFWYPWSENNAKGHWLNGNGAGSFAQCWRYVVDRMRDRYAAMGKAWNLTLVWCLDVLAAANAGGGNTARNRTVPAQVYPGDNYVDWRAFDAYSRSATDTFQLLCGGCIQLLNTGAGAGITGSRPCGVSKPIIVKETNATIIKNQSAFLANLDAVTNANTYPDLRGVGLFDLDSSLSDPVERTQQALEIYRTMLRRPTNPGAAHADLAGTPIRPLP